MPVGETDDAELVLRARHDRQAFAPLYERYFDAVYRYCYHRLGNWDDAEDAASLVFTNALAALSRFHVGAGRQSEGQSGSFRSWLFAIAHNVVGNTYRSRRAGQSLMTALDLADRGPSPDEIAAASEAHETVHRLLAQLPVEQRRLLELRIAGLNDADIAGVLGMSHGAVRVAQHRAITRLRAYLGIDRSGKEVAGVAR